MYLYIYNDTVVLAERDDRLMNDPEVLVVSEIQSLCDLWQCQDFSFDVPDEEKLEVLAEVYGGMAELADLFRRLDNPLA